MMMIKTMMMTSRLKEGPSHKNTFINIIINSTQYNNIPYKNNNNNNMLSLPPSEDRHNRDSFKGGR